MLTDEETGEPQGTRPEHETYDIRYPPEYSPEEGNRVIFYPQDVAAYLKIIKENLPSNLIPLMMNPFALPSRQHADFYKKLDNNVLIYDPTIKRKDRLRHLHIDEKSMLLARAIGVFGSEESTLGEIDLSGKKVMDYNWAIGEPA